MQPPLAQLDPKRILLIKPSAIGDVVHALPILNLLRLRFPSAYIAWLVTPACAALLEGHRQLDEVILFHRRQFGWKNPGAAAGIWKLSRLLKKEKFDLVIDLQGLFRSAWLGWQTGSATRVGFAAAREFAWIFYNHRIADAAGHKDPLRTGHRHAIERYLDLAEALSCARSPVTFEFPISEADRDWAHGQTDPLGPYAVLSPGSNWVTKRWPVQRFAELAKKLRAQYKYSIVAAGTPNESDLARQIEPDLNLAGKTNLRQLIALLERASLVVCNDSGPMHIAAALGRPLVSLFGPTNPELTGPYGRPETVVRLDIPCSPCLSRTCSHQSCLQLLQTAPVASLAAAQLRSAANGG